MTLLAPRPPVVRRWNSAMRSYTAVDASCAGLRPGRRRAAVRVPRRRRDRNRRPSLLQGGVAGGAGGRGRTATRRRRLQAPGLSVRRDVRAPDRPRLNRGPARPDTYGHRHVLGTMNLCPFRLTPGAAVTLPGARACGLTRLLAARSVGVRISLPKLQRTERNREELRGDTRPDRCAYAHTYVSQSELTTEEAVLQDF